MTSSVGVEEEEEGGGQVYKIATQVSYIAFNKKYSILYKASLTAYQSKVWSGLSVARESGLGLQAPQNILVTLLGLHLLLKIHL